MGRLQLLDTGLKHWLDDGRAPAKDWEYEEGQGSRRRWKLLWECQRVGCVEEE